MLDDWIHYWFQVHVIEPGKTFYCWVGLVPCYYEARVAEQHVLALLMNSLLSLMRHFIFYVDEQAFKHCSFQGVNLNLSSKVIKALWNFFQYLVEASIGLLEL